MPALHGFILSFPHVPREHHARTSFSGNPAKCRVGIAHPTSRMDQLLLATGCMYAVVHCQSPSGDGSYQYGI